MYRIRTSDTHKPLFISNQIIDEYSENRVDTLHMKNLLHLGEDRYLTTLMLKHFPTYKTKFARDAKAQTVAPEDLKILLSQRRRWINSTIHNMAELVSLDNLCGFCCFSMRFVVFIDLLSTIIAPVTVAYLVYLIYLVAGEGQSIPTTSIIMIAAVYGLQALIFILNFKLGHVIWMIFYLIAIPLFSFALPLYSFWHMDDFSWGSTRVVVGEKGKKLLITDEGAFEESSIPLKTWHEYEQELWNQDDDNRSIGSWDGGPAAALSRARNAVQSNYGGDSVYGGLDHQSYAPFQYAGSHMGSQMGSVQAGGNAQGLMPYTTSMYSNMSLMAMPYGQQPQGMMSQAYTQHGDRPQSRAASQAGGMPATNSMYESNRLSEHSVGEGPSEAELGKLIMCDSAF